MYCMVARIIGKEPQNRGKLIGFRLLNLENITVTDMGVQDVRNMLEIDNNIIVNLKWLNGKFFSNNTSLALYPYANTDCKTKDNVVLYAWLDGVSYWVSDRHGIVRLLSLKQFKKLLEENKVCNVSKEIRLSKDLI